ncbi:MAG: hypothetical protein OEY28_09655 [Nitrospira sp.]|nr:hypothetical protein [Nitrospira sp.]
MDSIFLTFAAATAIVLFFGAAMATWIGKIIEADSDMIIEEARKKEAGITYPSRQQAIAQRHRPSLPSPQSRPRTYTDRRQMPPSRTDGF